jgi:hypothetical protein
LLEHLLHEVLLILIFLIIVIVVRVLVARFTRVGSRGLLVVINILPLFFSVAIVIVAAV